MTKMTIVWNSINEVAQASCTGSAQLYVVELLLFGIKGKVFKVTSAQLEVPFKNAFSFREHLHNIFWRSGLFNMGLQNWKQWQLLKWGERTESWAYGRIEKHFPLLKKITISVSSLKSYEKFTNLVISLLFESSSQRSTLKQKSNFCKRFNEFKKLIFSGLMIHSGIIT